MEDVNDQGGSNAVMPEVVRDEGIQSYSNTLAPVSHSFENSGITEVRRQEYDGSETIWLKATQVDANLQQAKPSGETMKTVYVLQQAARDQCAPPPTTHSVNVSEHLMASCLSSLQATKLQEQLQLTLQQQQQSNLNSQQQSNEHFGMAKNFLSPMQTWASASQKLDKGTIQPAPHSHQATVQVPPDSSLTQATIHQSVSIASQLNAVPELGDVIAVNASSESMACMPMMAPVSSNAYVLKAVAEAFPDKLIQEQKAVTQQYEICTAVEQEKILTSIADQTSEVAPTGPVQTPQNHLDQHDQDVLNKKADLTETGPVTEKQEMKKENRHDKHDKNKILSLLNDTLIQFCHNNLYFVEFVHITGRFSFNLDNRETMNLVVSQMATPQAFRDQTSPPPPSNSGKKLPLSSMSSKKATGPRRRGRPRKSPAQKKNSAKREPSTQDRDNCGSAVGRKAALQARQKLARIIPEDSEAEDVSNSGIDLSDDDMTADEDYVPDEASRRPPSNQSDAAPYNDLFEEETQEPGVKEIKKEEPDTVEGSISAMKSEQSNECGAVMENDKTSNSPGFACIHCARKFSSEDQLQKHIKSHKVFKCSEPECEQLVFYTRLAIRKHFRDVHNKQAKDLYRCSECLQDFLTQDQLTQHTHSPTSHICFVCGENFKDRSSLKQHKDVSHLEKSCHICGKNFISKPAFKRHLKRHKERACGKVKCNECNKEFTAHSSLFHHKKAVHSGIRPYQCTDCGLTFNFNNSLKLHRLKHSGIRPYKCDICDKSYLTASHLKNHVQALHSSSKQYVCPVCDKKFPYDNSLKLHLKLHSGDRPFMCAICSKSFVSRSALKVHESSHVDSKNYKCDICGKTYKTETLMRVHRRRHTADGSRYMCDICGNTYMYKSNLEVHYEVHGDAKKHKCKICGKLFKTYPTLYSHYLVHSDKNPYTCSQCGKAFKTKERLKAHSVRHSGLKPFVCDQCGSSFPDKGGLSKHKKTVHAEVARYACPVCSKPCNRADNLRVHMKIHGDPSLLKLSLEELAAVTRFAAAAGKMEATQLTGDDNQVKSLAKIQAKLAPSPKPDAANSQALHLLKAAQNVDMHIPITNAEAYIHSGNVNITPQSSADQLEVATNPQDVTSHIGTTPFIGVHHWSTDGTLHYQNLLISQGYPTAGMVQTQASSLNGANTIVYQAATQQNTTNNSNGGTQY